MVDFWTLISLFCFQTGETVLRTAIHSAGGYTQGWGGRPETGTFYEEQSVELERT
ncbi:hypothetical protein ACIRFF_15820 [Streptomyces cyaneofuscatus]